MGEAGSTAIRVRGKCLIMRVNPLILSFSPREKEKRPRHLRKHSKHNRADQQQDAEKGRNPGFILRQAQDEVRAISTGMDLSVTLSNHGPHRYLPA